MDRFTMFQSYFEACDAIPDESLQKEAMWTMCKFAFYGELPPEDLNPWVRVAIASALPSIASGIEKRLAGQKGGRGKKKEAPQKNDYDEERRRKEREEIERRISNYA